MKIVNNKIYIGRGETPTYDVSVIDVDSGAPFIIPVGVKKPVIEFIVRPSIYDREDDYAFRTYIDVKNVRRFDSDVPVEYVDPDDAWDNDNKPAEKDINKLFRLKIDDKTYEYRYYDESLDDDGKDSRWVKYDFRITFQFPYHATRLMDSKTYKYEVVLFDAEIAEDETGSTYLKDIIFKKFLRNATDFIVDGSLSE